MPINERINLTGHSFARGRNGKFRPREAELVEMRANEMDLHYYVGFRSRKAPTAGDPIQLYLNRRDTQRLRDLLRTVPGGQSKREYAIAQALGAIRNRGAKQPFDTLMEVEALLEEAE